MRPLSEHSIFFSQGDRQRIILSPWILQQRLAVSCCNSSSPEDAQMIKIVVMTFYTGTILDRRASKMVLLYKVASKMVLV